jgi:cytochrome c oxidase assembly factor CtaG
MEPLIVPDLALTLPAPLNTHTLGSIADAPVAYLVLAAAVALYLWGVVRVQRLHPRHPWSRGRTASFIGGVVVVALAIGSFIGVYDRVLFWDHMVQHLMLIMVAAPLLAVGAPVALLWRATTGDAHERVTKALRSPVARFLDHPLVAFVLYAVVIPLTHLTSFFDYTVESSAVDYLEHAIFLFAGYLFWRHIVGYEPSAHRLHPGMRLAYLAAAVPVDTFVGLSLSEARQTFPAFVAQHRTWGPSLLTDLHMGGVIMWVGGDSLMMLALIPAAVVWMRYEERRAIRVDRELDAIMPATPSTP